MHNDFRKNRFEFTVDHSVKLKEQSVLPSVAMFEDTKGEKKRLLGGALHSGSQMLRHRCDCCASFQALLTVSARELTQRAECAMVKR